MVQETKRQRLTLTLSLLMFVVIVCRAYLWIHLNPMFQGPDEVQHLAMTAQLDNNGLEIYKNPSTVTWYDFEESYDYKSDFYGQLGILTKTDRLPRYAPDGMWGNQEQQRLHRPGFDSKPGTDYYRHLTYVYPPLYYAVIATFVKFYRSLGDPKLITYQYLMRLPNLGFYIVFLAYLLLLTRSVLPGGWGLLAFAMAAWHPMFIFMSSVVNNDVALLPFTAGLFYHGSEIIQADRLKSSTQPSTKDRQSRSSRPLFHAAAAIIFAAGLCLTKNQGVLLGGLTLSLLSAYSFLRRDRATALACLGGLLLVAAIYALIPHLFGATVYAGTSTPISFFDYFYTFITQKLYYLVANTFGQFAWFEINYKPGVYGFFFLVFCLSFIAALVILFRQWMAGSLSSKGRALTFLIAIYGSYLAIIFLWQFLMMPKVGFIIQGRYALSALPVMFVALGFVLQELSSSSKNWRRTALLIGSSLLLFWFWASNAALWMIIKRFYVEPDQRIGFFQTILSSEQWWFRVFQYKPEYFKSSPTLISLIIITIAVQAILLFVVLRRLFSTPQIQTDPAPARAFRLGLRHNVSDVAARTFANSHQTHSSSASSAPSDRTLVVLPTYNEETCLPQLFSDLAACRNALHEAKIDLCFVDDGSTDKTHELLAASMPGQFVVHTTNIGVSGVLCTGAKIAKLLNYEYLIQCDSDGQHPVSAIPELLAAARKNQWDLTIGSRFCPPNLDTPPNTTNKPADRHNRKSTNLARYLGGQLIGIAIKILFGGKRIWDPTSGFRVYSRQALNILQVAMPDEYPEPESIALLKRHHLLVGELNVVMSPRLGGQSTLGGLANPMRFMIKVFLALLALRLNSRPVRI